MLRVELFEHSGETRIALKITADRVMALKPKPKDSKPKANEPPRRAKQERAGPAATLPLEEINDDIPFLAPATGLMGRRA